MTRDLVVDLALGSVLAIISLLHLFAIPNGSEIEPFELATSRFKDAASHLGILILDAAFVFAFIVNATAFTAFCCGFLCWYLYILCLYLFKAVLYYIKIQLAILALCLIAALEYLKLPSYGGIRTGWSGKTRSTRMYTLSGPGLSRER
ncbi:hypothetical protein F5883DRAFT_179641 [Diaporthe sp. PMI_573]|nr:hypothetical protein F5883DRAFT_179641 [Diaporthaceae sp. PMI_573]